MPAYKYTLKNGKTMWYKLPETLTICGDLPRIREKMLETCGGICYIEHKKRVPAGNRHPGDYR